MARCFVQQLGSTPHVRSRSVGELYKNNRSKSACTLNERKRLNNQAVWPVIFDITGPIYARALKTKIPLTLGPRGHHDWPVMSVTRRCGFNSPKVGFEERNAVVYQIATSDDLKSTSTNNGKEDKWLTHRIPPDSTVIACLHLCILVALH